MSKIICRDFFPILLDHPEELSRAQQKSLSEFQAQYTTEDDASFASLMARENAEKGKKYERVYGGKPALVADESRRLLLQPTEADESKFRKPSRQALPLAGHSAELNGPSINIKNTRFPKRLHKRRHAPKTPESSYTLPSPNRGMQLDSSLFSTPNREDALLYSAKNDRTINEPKDPDRAKKLLGKLQRK